MLNSCEQCLNSMEENDPIYFCCECRENYCSRKCLTKHLEENVHKQDLGWCCITNPQWKIKIRETGLIGTRDLLPINTHLTATRIVSIKPMLFSGELYYPRGGWKDFKGFFDDVESAKKWIVEHNPDATDKWAHILVDGEIVLEGGPDENSQFGIEAVWVWLQKEE